MTPKVRVVPKGRTCEGFTRPMVRIRMTSSMGTISPASVMLGRISFQAPNPGACAGLPGPARTLPGAPEGSLAYVVVQFCQPLLDIAAVAVRHRIHSSPWRHQPVKRTGDMAPRVPPIHFGGRACQEGPAGGGWSPALPRKTQTFSRGIRTATPPSSRTEASVLTTSGRSPMFTV